ALSVLYSSKEELRTAACSFWCSIVQLDLKKKKHSRGIEWFPSYSDLKSALEIYGFRFNVPLEGKVSYSSESQIIRAATSITRNLLLTQQDPPFLIFDLHSRSKRCIFSASEMGSLLEIVILLFLDRQLEGLLVMLYESMQCIINYFTDAEWPGACRNIATSLASRITARANNLRAELSHQFLLNCFDKASNEEEILNCLIAINVKEKRCDLLKMYIYIVLAENWLFSSAVLVDKPVLFEMWGVYLRNCSCHISSSDLRPYAAKVRSRATYLIHNSTKKY
ncbi:hypothetical protein LINPERPRIM_LOCUS8182, partial [Linum perenne]